MEMMGKIRRMYFRDKLSRREPVMVWASLTAVGQFADHLGIKGFAM